MKMFLTQEIAQNKKGYDEKIITFLVYWRIVLIYEQDINVAGLTELLFDVAVIISIGAGGFFGKNCTFLYFTNEEHMRAEVQLFFYLTAEECVGVFGDVIKVVGTTFDSLKTVEFIGVATALHTEMSDGFKGNGLG